MGEQADYELDRMFDGHWSDGWWNDDAYQVAQPPRPGYAAPAVKAAKPTDFPLVAVARLCDVCLEPEPNHARHCVIGFMKGYHEIEPPMAPRQMEVLEWPSA